jgi:flagellar motor protein MotB
MNRSLFIILAFFLTRICIGQHHHHHNHGEELVPTETSALVKFFVTDDNKIPEEGANVHIESEDKSTQFDGKANIDGLVAVLLPEGKKYNIRVQKFGKEFNFEREIPVADGGFEYTQFLLIKVVTFYVRGFTLNHLYFDVNKYEIKKEAIPTLEKLYQSFKKNPKMKAEIAGHTDNTGNDDDNLRLSQRRADAIRDYLITKGISPDRLLAKGYGEKTPVAPNSSEYGRSKNRRTEVRIIEE